MIKQVRRDGLMVQCLIVVKLTLVKIKEKRH